MSWCDKAVRSSGCELGSGFLLRRCVRGGAGGVQCGINQVRKDLESVGVSQ